MAMFGALRDSRVLLCCDGVAVLVSDSSSLNVEFAIVVVAARASLLSLPLNSLLVGVVLFGLAGWCILGLFTCEHAKN